MTNAAEMQIVVELKDKASASLKNVDRSFSNTAKGVTANITKMVAKFALLAGAAAIGGTIIALKKSITVFKDFEYAVASAASVTGAVGEAFEETKKNIEAVSRELGKTTIFSASEAANAFYDLASAGYDVANMVKSDLQPILDVAAGTQSDLTKTTEAVTATLGQFGLGIDSVGRVADVFARAIGSSKAELIKLEYSLKQAGPIANSMGMEIEEVVAILGNLYNAGFKGEQAGTALRGAFARLLNPTKQVKDKLEELGLTLEDVNPETNKFADILDTLSEAGMDTADAFVIFGQEVAPAMTAVIETTDEIRELEESLLDSAGAARLMAEQSLDTLEGALKTLKSVLEDVWITIGGKVAPHFRKLVEQFTEFIPIIMDVAGDIWNDLEPALQKLWNIFKDIYPKIKVVGSEIIDRLSPGVKDLKSAWDSIIKIASNLISGFNKSETATSALTAIVDIAIDTFNWFAKSISVVLDYLAEHPKVATVVVAAIALMIVPILKIIAVVILLATAWNENWFGIKDTTLRVVGIISDFIKVALVKIEAFWSDHGDTIMAIVNYLWTGIKTTIDIVLSTIMLIINVFLDVLEGDWSSAWNRIKEYASNTLNKLSGLFVSWKENILPIFGGVWDSAKQYVIDWADTTWTKIITWMSNLDQRFIDWVNGILDTLRGWYDKIVDFFDFSDIKVKWPDLDIPDISLPEIGKPKPHDDYMDYNDHSDKHSDAGPHKEAYDVADYDHAAPHKEAYDVADYDHTTYDVGFDAGYDHSIFGYKKGGPVKDTGPAIVHEGEWVVPKSGALVAVDSDNKKRDINITYNIYGALGIENLKKMLDDHDRELYRRLVSLV